MLSKHTQYYVWIKNKVIKHVEQTYLLSRYGKGVNYGIEAI